MPGDGTHGGVVVSVPQGGGDLTFPDRTSEYYQGRSSGASLDTVLYATLSTAWNVYL